jgi:NitT/TauT family transport system substrate-binding protein
MTELFRVAATGHSLNYLPEYVAAHRGYFAEEGLHVEAIVPKPWDLVLDELAAGTSAVALGGIWVPSMYFGRAARYTPFAQVAARAPLALLGRGDPAGFQLAGLRGSTVLMKGSNGASVGVFLKMMLRENGVDPRDVRFVQDLDGAMLSDLFTGGMGDYLIIDYPSAARIAADHPVTLACRFSETGGPVPWSVYYALGVPTDEQRDRHTRFTRALARGTAAVRDVPAAEHASLLETLFPALGAGLLVELTDQYRAWGMWPGPRIDPDAYARWQRGIADAGLTDGPLPYDDLIDSEPTERVLKAANP